MAVFCGRGLMLSIAFSSFIFVAHGMEFGVMFKHFGESMTRNLG